MIILKKRKKLNRKPKVNMEVINEVDYLTTGQHNGLHRLNQWIKDTSKDNLRIVLTGPAGSGKTTLIREFIKQNQLWHKNFTVAAPTHQAKEVIGDLTGITDPKTVQELLGLKPDLDLSDFDPYNPAFEPISKAKILDYDILCIDESSMINKSLYKYLKDFSNNYKIKILFVGDKRQLPPIKEVLSEVFQDNENIVLDQVVRQNGDNPLKDLLSLIITDIDNQTNIFETKIVNFTENFNSKEEGYKFFTDSTKFYNSITEAYKFDETKNSKFLTWTNQIVDIWNLGMRKSINPDESQFNINDTLIGYVNIADKKGNKTLQNSKEYKVKEVHRKREVFNITVNYKPQNVPLIYYDVLLEDENKNKNWVKIIEDISINNYKILNQYYIELALTKGWKHYYNNFRNLYLTPKEIELDTLNKWGKKEKLKKQIDYNYCLTIHKSQGTTLTNSFIHLKDIMNNPDIRERNQLIYVALSRCRKATYIFR